MRIDVVSVLIVVTIAVSAGDPNADSKNQRNVQKVPSTYTNTYNETRAKNLTGTGTNGKERKTTRDPLLILWIAVGISGFLITLFIICYCLFKFCDSGEEKETSERELPHQQGNKQSYDVEALQTLQEEGQVIEFLQMLEQSSRKSLERNLGPPRKEDFGSGNNLHGSRQKNSYIIPQKLTDGNGSYSPPHNYSDVQFNMEVPIGPLPNNHSHVQTNMETPYYNYGFEDEEDSFRSELEHAHKGYCPDKDNHDRKWDGDCGEIKTVQTHRRLWYEDSISECNDNIFFTANRLEQSCVENHEYDQEQQHLNDGHSYILNSINVIWWSADEQEQARFCEKVSDTIIDSQHGNTLEQSCVENDEYDKHRQYLDGGKSYFCNSGNVNWGPADDNEHAQFCEKVSDIIIESQHGNGLEQSFVENDEYDQQQQHLEGGHSYICSSGNVTCRSTEEQKQVQFCEKVSDIIIESQHGNGLEQSFVENDEYDQQQQHLEGGHSYICSSGNVTCRSTDEQKQVQFCEKVSDIIIESQHGNGLEQSFVENDEYDQQQQHLEGGHSYICSSGNVTCRSTDEQKQVQFCEKVSDIIIESQHGNGLEQSFVENDEYDQQQQHLEGGHSYICSSGNVTCRSTDEQKQVQFCEKVSDTINESQHGKRLEQSCVKNDGYDQQQQHLDNGQSYIFNSGNVTWGSTDGKEQVQFCEKVSVITSDSQHGTFKDIVIKIVTVESEYIQQDKGNVADSLFNSKYGTHEQKQQDIDSSGGDFEEELNKNNQKKANYFDEFDDVEFGFSGYPKRIRSTPESELIVAHAADSNIIYQELLRGSIAALAIANGATDVPFNSEHFIQETKKIPSKESPPPERETKRSFKSKEYGSLVNERENDKDNFCRQSVLKRISKRRKDSRQRFRNSSIGKHTRKFSKKVAKGLSRVKSKKKKSSSKQSPAFVVASL